MRKRKETKTIEELTLSELCFMILTFLVLDQKELLMGFFYGGCRSNSFVHLFYCTFRNSSRFFIWYPNRLVLNSDPLASSLPSVKSIGV